MESVTSLKIENITKVYKLYKKPIDRLKEALNPFRRKYHSDFYALRDVSLEIKKGETVGIIGKNGSGKSTLLKIITGVLSPSRGKVEVNGKISALLELGAGFNPEFTGVQNIYLNGSMLGYSKEQMDRKIESILEFADIGDFAFQPVKMYSSGMFVRLAFAVAINVDPEILIVDEALSVGDIRFQQKCYRKIREFKKKGTVIFVSHDLGAVTNFCDRVIWLNNGEKFKEGDPEELVDEYQSFMNYDYYIETSGNSNNRNIEKDDLSEQNFFLDAIHPSVKSFGKFGAEIIGASIINSKSVKSQQIYSGEEVEIMIKVKVNKDIFMPLLGFVLKDRFGNQIMVVNTEFEKTKMKYLHKDETHIFKWKFQFPKIKSGTYTIDLAIAEGTYENHEQHHWLNDALVIEVRTKKRYPYGQGLCLVDNIQFVECS